MAEYAFKIDKDLIDSDLTDFPVDIHLNSQNHPGLFNFDEESWQYYSVKSRGVSLNTEVVSFDKLTKNIKSVVFDVADNWGATDYLGIRQVDFWYKNTKLLIESSDFDVYYTSVLDNRYDDELFNIATSKTGGDPGHGYASIENIISDLRIIIVFKTEQIFDEIIINNYHFSGSYTNRGAKNTKIHISTDEITSTVYDEIITNSTLIFDGQLREHIATDIADPETLSLTELPQGKAHLIARVPNISSTEDTLITITKELAYQTPQAVAAPVDEDAIFYLPSNTTAGSTTFNDESGNDHSITPTGGVTHEAPHKIGSSSILFNASRYLTISTNVAVAMAAQPFKISCWVYLNGRYCVDNNGISYGNVILSQSINGSSGEQHLRIGQAGNVTYSRSSRFGDNSVSMRSNSIIPLKKWTHISFSADSSKWKFFINGILDKEMDQATYWINTETALYLGQVYVLGYSSYSQKFNGYIDDFRIDRNLLATDYTMKSPSLIGKTNEFYNWDELAGDDFTGTDDDVLDVVLWKDHKTDLPLSINSNQARANAVVNSMALSRYHITGDFDIQVDFDIGATSDIDSHAVTLGVSTSSGWLYQVDRRKIGTAVYAIYYDEGSGWVAGSSTATTDTDGKYRITRAGSTISFYYWGGSSWTLVGTKTNATTDDVMCYLSSATWENSPTTDHRFDNFQINSGTVKYCPAQQVWDDNYQAVYHMSQDPSGGADCILDSTSNQNHGTPQGSMTSDDLIDTDYGKALEFDGVDDYIVIPDNSSFDLNSAGTIETLLKVSDISTYGSAIIGNLDNSNNGFGLAVRGDTYTEGQLTLFTNNAWQLSHQTLISTDVEHSIAVVSNGTTINIYLNEIISSAYTGTLDNTSNDLAIGNLYDSGSDLWWYDGLLNDIRISNTARSASWIKTSSLSMKNQLLALATYPIVGDTLYVTPGSWTEAPTSYAFQWQRNNINIPEAISNSYILTSSDGEQDITCEVIATNSFGPSIMAESNVLVPYNMAFTAKSVILDIADNWGSIGSMQIRSIDFWYRNVKITVFSADITCYATSTFVGSYTPNLAFDTSLSKTGAHTENQWASGNVQISNQRLICIFDSEIVFDKIVLNNAHGFGADTQVGAKNTKITISTDSITDTTYNASITNSTLIFDGEIREHIGADQEDPETLVLL